jgi:amino acid transporter
VSSAGRNLRICANVTPTTASRLLYASAKDGLLPSILDRLSSRQTPDRAICYQAVMTILFVVFGGGFRSLVSFFSVANWTFFFATVNMPVFDSE